MEQINRIELKGNIGSAVKTGSVGNETIVRFDLATNRLFTTKAGEPALETTWHHIVAFLGDGISDCTLAQIRRGSFAHITGRVRSKIFIDDMGAEQWSYEVFATAVEVLKHEGE